MGKELGASIHQKQLMKQTAHNNTVYPNRGLHGVSLSASFTGKERDEETGYGYFGARYMDHELMTMWLSVDPMADKYPGISPYAYCAWNPVKLVDLHGEYPVDPAPREVIGTPMYYIWRLENFKKRNPGVTPPTYYMEYGFKYAKRFNDETKPQLSLRGQEWLAETMTNLQLAMELRLSEQDGSELELNDDEFTRFAYSTHAKAYLNDKKGKTPLSALNTNDLFTIVLTPDLNDICTAEGMKQVWETMSALLDYWSSHPITGAKRALELVRNKPMIMIKIGEKLQQEINPNQ